MRGLLLLVAVVGCAAPASQRLRSATELQTRELQTRTYDTTDTAMVMKALVNVLQDDGFIVKTASGDIGLITATKERTERHWYFIFAKDITDSWTCSVNISAFGQETKVRVNVQETIKTWPDNTERTAPVDDPTFYRDFFARVDKGIFIQKEKL
jgi:hypothetical protein